METQYKIISISKWGIDIKCSEGGRSNYCMIPLPKQMQIIQVKPT